MATTPIVGYDGTASLTTAHNATLKAWSANFTRVVSNVTGFSDTGMRRRLGMPDVQGSASGTMNYDDVNTGPGLNATDWNRSGVAITLSPAAGTACQYAFTGTIGQCSMSSDKLGDAPISFDFELAGGAIWTEAWDETA